MKKGLLLSGALASSAFADITSMTTTAETSITGLGTAVETIGLAIIGVAVILGAVKIVKSMAKSA